MDQWFQRLFAAPRSGAVSTATIQGYLRAASQIEEVWQQIDEKVDELIGQGQPPWEAFVRMGYALAFVRAARMNVVCIQELLKADAAANPTLAGIHSQMIYDQALALCEHIEPYLEEALKAATNSHYTLTAYQLPLELGPHVKLASQHLPQVYMQGLISATREMHTWAAGILAKYEIALQRAKLAVPSSVTMHMEEMKSELEVGNFHLRTGIDMVGQMSLGQSTDELNSKAEDFLWEAMASFYTVSQLVALSAALAFSARQVSATRPQAHQQLHPVPPVSSPLAQKLATRESPGSARLPHPPVPVHPPERPRRAALMGVLLLLILVVGGSLGIWRVMVTAQANSKSNNVTAPGIPGKTWHTQDSGTGGDLPGIVWSGSQFVAVGDSGILTSPDGRIWTVHKSGTSRLLWGVTWSGSQFVAVGEYDTILTSPDGRTWTSQRSGDGPPDLYSVAWSGSQFVAVGADPPSLSGVILTSPDGHTWTPQHAGTARLLQSVIWTGSQFVTVGFDTILTSPDGRTWTSQRSGTSQQTLRGVIWSGSQFVAIGEAGTILTSPDGHTWTAQRSGTSQYLFDVAWSGSQFVAVGGEWHSGYSGIILTSPDGHTWTSQGSRFSFPLFGVIWAGSQFVAVGSSGLILTSP